MSSENQAKLFEKFGKIVQTSRHINPEGIGLGLFICKSLVTELGGKLSLTSEENVGTSVKVTLPIRQTYIAEPDGVTELVREVALTDLTDYQVEVVELQASQASDSAEFSSIDEAVFVNPRDHIEQARASANRIKELFVSQMYANEEEAEELAGIPHFIPQEVLSKNNHVLGDDVEPDTSGVKLSDSEELKEALQYEQEERNEERKCNCRQILVVEDDAFSSLCLVEHIASCGLGADQAENGRIAVQAFMDSLECHPYRAIFMDMNMPVMGGVEAAVEINREIRAYNARQRELNNRRRIARLPIIACTANDTKEDRAKCRNAGMSKFMRKPVVIEDVREFVKTLK